MSDDESAKTLPNPPPYESTVPPPAPALEVPVENEDDEASTYLSAEQKYKLTWLITLAVVVALLACLWAGVRFNESNNDRQVEKTRAQSEACAELTNDVDQVRCMEKVD